MRKILLVCVALMLLLGCSNNPKPNTTPQYQIAQGNVQFSTAVNVVCKLEINFKIQIDPAIHKAIQEKCIQVAGLDDQITTAIQNNDFATAKSYANTALVLVQGMGADILNIKDPSTQQALQIAQTGAVGAIEVWIGLLPK